MDLPHPPPRNRRGRAPLRPPQPPRRARVRPATPPQEGRPIRPILAPALAIAALLLAACEGEVPAQLRVAGGDADRGRVTVAAFGCGGCHVIPGVNGAVSWAGPPLTEWARRGYLAGHLPNSPDNLVAWLRNPQAISPESAMPNLGLTEAQARDAAAYLLTLGASRLPPVPAGMQMAPGQAGPQEQPRIRPRA